MPYEAREEVESRWPGRRARKVPAAWMAQLGKRKRVAARPVWPVMVNAQCAVGRAGRGGVSGRHAFGAPAPVRRQYRCHTLLWKIKYVLPYTYFEVVRAPE